MEPNNRYIARLTDSQQRFEALWKKRMEGEPTLKELAEMDEIINRDPLIHQFVLKEMENWATSSGNNGRDTLSPPAASPLRKISEKVRSFFKHLFAFFIIESNVAVN